MDGKRRSALVSLLFFAFTAPFGIVAHLVSELAGLGWHDDADVVLSARHGYLAVIAIASLAIFSIVLRAVPANARRQRVAEIVEALPFAGRGVGFLALSFAVQFGFFAVSQIGEGCPLCGGDVSVGVLAAAAAALLGALIVTIGKRHVLEFAAALAWYVAKKLCLEATVVFRARKSRVVAHSGRRTPFAFRYRPPPLAA